MSTRSTISVVTSEGKIHSIYCHNDGYLSWNGKNLIKHYNNLESALQLVSFGDMSSLSEKCIPEEGTEHSFDEPQKDVCVYYGRDRGEPDTEYKVYENQYQYLKCCDFQDYNYLFKNGNWFLVEDDSLIKITEQMTK